MKLRSVPIFCLLGSIQAKQLNVPSANATAVITDKNEIHRNLLKSVQCIVSEVQGLALPGSPEVPTQYTCTTREGDVLFFDGDASALLHRTRFVSGETRLSLTPKTMTSDGKIRLKKVVDNSFRGNRRNIFRGNSRKKLTTNGLKSVLVIRVVSNNHAPSQSEAQLYDDVFADDNNLRVRYNDCSNGALIFDPATGASVNNGVLTVTTTNDLTVSDWKKCGTIATSGANALGISRDFTMVVCPDVVDFGNSAAFAITPGVISWYKSQYFSTPGLQVHEVGHNLGHGHSGKDGSLRSDPTDNMGNQGSWSDAGTNFCFNAAKTWANKWYESYHVTVDPTIATYDGTLVGINAVKDSTIAAGQDVVLKISSSAETNLYVMFNRKAGANNEVPGYGDQVVITEQALETASTSWWQSSLSSGEVYTQHNWGSAGTLTVKVCSLDTGSPGTARILVYATGHATLSCDASTPAPTKATVTSPPTKAPVTSITTGGSLKCQDNDESFLFNGRSTRTCKFISMKAGKRCSKAGAAENCPVTCTNECTCSDTEGTFLTRRKGKNCNWAANRSKRCNRNEVRSNCPLTCGVCSVEGQGSRRTNVFY